MDNQVYLWMDTLCIPVHPSAERHRKKAIRLLGKTFHEAAAVLVVDRELDYVESTTSSFLELGMRILCSGWMKRLWTLQEATLGSEAHGMDKIYFQMKDDPFQYQKYDRWRRSGRGLDKDTTEVQSEERILLFDDWILVQLGEALPTLQRLREAQLEKASLSELHKAIQRRLTSKIEDVPLCVASLLEMDIAPILSVTTLEEKMAQFYLVLQEVPIGLLWTDADEVKKTNIPHSRWVPLSLTACGQNTYLGWPHGMCDQAGLHFSHTGMIIRPEDIARYKSKSKTTTQFSEPFKVVVYKDSQEYCCMYLWPQDGTVSIPLSAALIVPHSKPRRVSEVLLLEIESTNLATEGGPETVCMISGHLSLLEYVAKTSATLRADLTTVNHRWCVT